MLDAAKRAALEAGEITLKRRFQKYSFKNKGEVGDIVTEVDLASEKRILQILKKRFPSHNYLSEEAGRQDNGSEFCWVIDPIDGTLAYFSGLPTYGISIGLLKNGQPELGVIYFPALEGGELYWGQKGKGAFLNGKAIGVNKEKNLEKCIVGFDFWWMGKREEEIEKFIKPMADKVRYLPTFACAVSGLAYVACGIYGAYFHRAYPWDFAAGAAIIEEAGGKVTDYKGNKVDWSQKEISMVASNGLIHGRILEIINQ